MFEMFITATVTPSYLEECQFEVDICLHRFSQALSVPVLMMFQMICKMKILKQEAGDERSDTCGEAGSPLTPPTAPHPRPSYTARGGSSQVCKHFPNLAWILDVKA